MQVNLLKSAPHEMSLTVGGDVIATVRVSATKCLRETRFSIYVTDPTNELLRTDPKVLEAAAEAFLACMVKGSGA